MQEGDVRHRLLAILAADAAGYSRLMSGDDVATLRSLDAARNVFRTHIEAHDGRVIDMAGDSVLASFETVGGAVNASRTIQEILTAQGEEVPEAKRLNFRIGIHLGDVLEKSDGTVYGDGVNIAARLQTLAEPGGITVSHAVRDAVFSRVGAAFEDLGEQTVKNIERPVQAFRMRWDKISGAVGALGAPRTAPRSGAAHKTDGRNAAASEAPALGWLRSIRRGWWGLATVALLGGVGTAWLVWPGFGTRQTPSAEAPPMSLAIEPFIAPSGDAAIGQLAQTLRRDLLTGLAAVERSVKTVQSDSESNVSGGVNLPDRSRRPNARYVVQGEVRRGGNGQVSVSLRMTDVLAGTQFWGEQYDLPEQDATVESAAKRRQIVRQLAATVTSAETRRVMTLPIDRLAAAELVLRGIAAEREDSPNSLMEARKLYDAALRLEPALVSAIARRVWSLVQESDERTSQLDYERIAPEVDRWSIRALNLDATDPMVWRVRSDALAVLGQRHAALEAQEHTIKLDPYRIDHYVNKAWLLLKLARPTEALGVIDHALTMNPVNAEGLLRMACEAYLLLERIDDAITTCEKAAGLSSDTTTVQLLLAAAYANRGDAVKAAAAKAELLKADPQFTMSRMLALQHNNAPEYRKLAEGSIYAGLRKAGIPE